jgi:S1-C subfamily serine protease
MKHFSRLALVTGIASCIVAAPLVYAEGLQLSSVMQDSTALLMHNNQGYLGVDIRDLDNDRAQALRLRDTRGAEIVTVDHDAPAGKAGIHVHDVVLQMNGQVIENGDQLRRLLHDIPPGGNVTFILSRDGSILNVSLQLADRAKLEHDAWPRHYDAPEAPPSGEGHGFFSSGGGSGPGGSGGPGPAPSHGFGSWNIRSPRSNLYIGATVDALGAQLADYFGVKNGLLIKSVDDGSPAANAGLKAGDVILKIGKTEMKSPEEWTKTLHSNQGKSVQLTILRDRRQQLMTLETPR